MVLNKWDALTSEEIPEANNLASIPPAPGRHRTLPSQLKIIEPSRAFQVSAAAGEGLEELSGAVLEHLQESDIELSFIVPHARGEVIAYLRENAHLQELDYQEDGAHVRCSISPARGARLKHIFPEGFASAGS